ncbi:MAG: TMEM175 family protein [Bacteroidota bacterium]|nr:TMEM175 family protein [Bacteroidota bacterium]MDP4232994.1 TMEM175 family protein [Bacteroidota bacterium]MDP4242038.1 TMEM175 family protein [Bacteroidota bacterium]MDP4286941.1 TMEM175 family protein [Bacteroidota bacterium]
MNKTRLEAFSDGVFAIIVTIMVLELKIPHGTDWSAVKPLVPTLGSYLLSFLFVGSWWINHHHLLHAVEQVNSTIMLANLHFLFWLSLIPTTTGWMGENGFDSVTVAVYGGLLICGGLSFLMLAKIISADYPTDHKFTQVFQRMSIKGTWSMVLYVVSIPLAFVHPAISCGLFAVVLTMWFIPDKKVEKILIEG